METPKIGIHYTVALLYYTKNASTRSGSNATFDCVRPTPSTRVLEFLWISSSDFIYIHTLHYLIALHARVFFWQKKSTLHALIRYLHVYSKTIELVGSKTCRKKLHRQKWLNREEPASSKFLNKPNSNLKITTSICLKNFQQKWSK